MRVLKSVALFVDWVVAIVLGASAVIWGVWDFISEGGAVIRLEGFGWRGQLAMLIAGLVLVILNAALVWDFLSRLFGADYLKLEGTGGRVNVSIKALQDALERAVREIPEVTSARVRVSDPARKGRPVVVRAYVRLKGRVVYHSISRAIISGLEKTFSDIVSEGAKAQCHVFWEKISPERSASAAGAQRSASPRPRFPVDEERGA